MIARFRSCLHSLATLLCAGALLAADNARAQAGETAGAEVVMSALGLVGVPYHFGGNDPAIGLDCSGLVQVAMRNALGLELPRQSEAIGRLGVPVDRDELQPGDLVFFNTLARPFSHVGIYVGEGQFVHAPSERGRVRIESLGLPYWIARFDGARRLVAQAGAPPRADEIEALWQQIRP